MREVHVPVLLKEVLEIFDPQPGQNYIDATINGGGHASAILEKIGSTGRLLGIDWDSGLIEELKIKFRKSKFKNTALICDNYANLKSISAEYNFNQIDGIIFDLGFSSHQLEKSGGGFSFLRDEPLDMRYNPKTNELSAEKIINTWSKEAIADVLWKFGEERFSRRIASAIVDARAAKPIRRTNELVRVVARSVPAFYLNKKLHPATKAFQALRIAVNGELDNLEKGLSGALEALSIEGKIIVISFHSLEDRIVKNIFREESRKRSVKLLTPKPVIPSLEETKNNPRARSAKLRAVKKI